jgi:hypothetical protein
VWDEQFLCGAGLVWNVGTPQEKKVDARDRFKFCVNFRSCINKSVDLPVSPLAGYFLRSGIALKASDDSKRVFKIAV